MLVLGAEQAARDATTGTGYLGSSSAKIGFMESADSENFCFDESALL